MVKRITDLLPPPKTPFWQHWKEVVVAVFCAILFVMAWILAAIFFAGVTGCCLDYTVKKCCPPPKYIDVPVKVQVPCNLPPPVKLEAVTRVTAGCPEKMTCFDVENAARLADRE